MPRLGKGLQSGIHIILKFTFIENEAFNCLSCQGYNLKHNFGLWRQCRDDAGTRRNFFNDLRCLSQRYWFPNWTSLLTEMLADHAPRAGPGLTLT